VIFDTVEIWFPRAYGVLYFVTRDAAYNYEVKDVRSLWQFAIASYEFHSQTSILMQIRERRKRKKTFIVFLIRKYAADSPCQKLFRVSEFLLKRRDASILFSNDLTKESKKIHFTTVFTLPLGW